MQTQLVNFIAPRTLLKQADFLAKEESRSRSEVIREALRYYIEERVRRKADFDRIRRVASRINLTEEEAMKLAEEAKQWARKQQ